MYDHAPVGYFTIDPTTALSELNLAGARMLGLERDAFVGRRLEHYLTSDGLGELRAPLAQLTECESTEIFELPLAAGSGAPRTVRASVTRNPAGENFLLALLDDDANAARREA